MLFSRPKFQYMVLISQKSCTWNDQEYVESDQNLMRCPMEKQRFLAYLLYQWKNPEEEGSYELQ